MVDKKATYPPIVDVLIVGAGPCGLAAAARLREETPSAIFTDDEHQRYHWINKHSGRMPLVQAHHRRVKGVRAEKWKTYNSRSRQRTYSSVSTSSNESEAPSLSSSVDSAPDTEEAIMGEGSLSTIVLDGTGQRWMERWNRAFETLEIEQLRSPMFFHVDPGDRDGLLAYTGETGREGDLWEITGCVGKEMSKHKRKKKMMRSKAQAVGEVEIDERDRKDYFSPSTGLFADYCESIISRYGLDAPGTIQQREACDIKYDYHMDLSPTEKIFTVTNTDGTQFYSRTVVLAIGPGRRKILPFPLSAEETNGACHSTEIRSFPSPNIRQKVQQRRETNVVVVGGGLSSAQLVDMAVRKGVTKVWFIMRSDLKVKHFDIDLSWMGKFKNYEKAAFWSADTDEERLKMIQAARNGGSVTPRYQKVLRQHAARHRVSMHTRTVITGREYSPETQTWRLTTEPPIADLPAIDYIYFATGMGLDVQELPLLQTMSRDYPIETKGGLPCVTDDLMWHREVPLFVTGRMGALRLGPGAANLEGARLGAERIAWGMDEVLGRAETEDTTAQRSKECFCGLGNRYAGLADVSW
ncbi:FAD/NAD(P)-binding domain-containing protein [Aspergillus campestris IBT 28561]|uniref:L-ornithine N(5)-monooxygenase n=1 Tax=Aspergillus campestris (strain IBT 28561) TaxID=1392248 RepID=A0A2I1DE35_ASPC2|nr:FAD/NAD(P)-binding domain-containing protein [Aspergillus campestris IBT 28561]PKY08149.1 FAD/NAD(P)-binding domain-containing protein [Aspergillus campestris IBT 28561]